MHYTKQLERGSAWLSSVKNPRSGACDPHTNMQACVNMYLYMCSVRCLQ